MGNKYDISGERFGRWTVLEKVGKNARGDSIWRCVCDCGNIKDVCRIHLRRGHSRSCGCLKLDLSLERIKKAQGLRHLPEGEASLNRIIKQYEIHAAKRGYDFNLTRDKFAELTKMDCHYCGLPPSNVSGRNASNGKYIYNGIDRKNNKEGYNNDNVVPCCKKCNRAKDTMSYEEYLDFIKRSYKKQCLT